MKKELNTQDHLMVGLTALMLFIAMKMVSYSAVLAGLLIWFNMSMFDRYARRRRDETS